MNNSVVMFICSFFYQNYYYYYYYYYFEIWKLEKFKYLEFLFFIFLDQLYLFWVNSVQKFKTVMFNV